MHYKIFGSKIVDIVIEMGLGACIAEWEALARELGENHGVLVYERAGINHSDKSDKESSIYHKDVETGIYTDIFNQYIKDYVIYI